VPASASLVEDDRNIEVWRTESSFWVKSEVGVLYLDPEEGRARGYVDPTWLDAGKPLRARLLSFLIVGVLVLVRYRHFYPLHAAALTNGSQSVLFVAESDCGKSTMAYGLLREGWQYLSDDTVLLTPTASGVEAVGFRRNFGLDAISHTIFPELATVAYPQLNDPEKWCIPIDQIYPGQYAERSQPNILLFPQIVDRPTSELVRVGVLEALGHLMQQSALLMWGADLITSHLAVLQRLVHQTRSYKLLAGRDLLENPSHLTRLLDTVLVDTKSLPEPLSVADVRSSFDPKTNVVYTLLSKTQGLLIRLDTKQHYSLNETGVFIWECVSEGYGLMRIASMLAYTYDVPLDLAQKHVEAAASAFEKARLISARVSQK
jgi:hypothetical protein